MKLPNSQKGFALILTIFLIALVIGGYLFYTKAVPSTVSTMISPKPTVSSNAEQWQTYTNTKDNFTIQYPPIYKHEYRQDINKNETSPYAIKSLDVEDWHSGNPRAAGGYSGDHIVLDIYPDSGDRWSQIPEIGPNDETVTWGGEKALKKIGLGGRMIVIGPIKHNGMVYKFQYDLPDKQTDAYNFYRMISTFKFTDQAVSPSKNKTVPKEIQAELPLKSSDGKDVIPVSMSDDNDFVIYRTFVKERGAGKEYDYWVYNRTTKASNNLSNQIKRNEEFVSKYRSNSSFDSFFITFYDRWLGENPVFSVVDGWSIVGEYWVYDLKKGTFFYYPRKD